MRVLIALFLSVVFALPMMAAGYFPGGGSGGGASFDALPLKISTTPYTLLGSEVVDIWADISNQSATLYLPVAPSDGKQYRLLAYSSVANVRPYQLTIEGNGKLIGGNSNSILRAGDVNVLKFDDATGTWHKQGGLITGSNVTQQHLNANAIGTGYVNCFDTKLSTPDAGTVSLDYSGVDLHQTVRYANSAATDVTYLLPGCFGSGGGLTAFAKVWIIQKLSSNNNVLITPDGANTIGGASSVTLTEGGEVIAIQSSYIGGDWKVLWHYKPSSVNVFVGTTSAMVAGTVTVANTKVKTGDIIQATRVSGAGVSAGITSYSIINATSFTLNGVGTDDGIYSYTVIRP